jgi:hypothetical protein
MIKKVFISSTHQETKGNLSVSVVVDSAIPDTYAYVQPTIIAALEHFGIPFRIVDLSAKTVSKDDLANSSAILIAQEDIGLRFSDQLEGAVITALDNGTGLVNFDPSLNSYSPRFKKIWGRSFLKAFTGSIKKTFMPHYITHSQERLKIQECRKPVPCYQASDPPPLVETLLENEKGNPVLLSREEPKYRMVQFMVSPRIWLRDYFGHAEGLDDVFWKSIVWAAKKPFLMKAMPPFMAMRIDDCYGWENFRWVDVANRHGYIPNLGLFTACIQHGAGPAMKKLYDNHLAEFSPHAYAEDPDLFLIYYRHDRKEYTVKDVEKRLKKLEEQFAQWGVGMSAVLNPHYEEVGKNAMPALLARKMTYRMMTYLPGEIWWGEHDDWQPRPYGHYGFAMDYLPGYPDVLAVSANMIPWKLLKKAPGKKYAYIHPFETLYEVDFFWKASESQPVDLDEAIARGTRQIKNGMDNLFFGLLFTHENLLARHFTLEQFDFVLDQIEKNTSEYPKIYKGYDYIAQYARCKLQTYLERADYDNQRKQIAVTLRGQAALPVILYVFEEKAGRIQHRLMETPAFSESRSSIIA